MEVLILRGVSGSGKSTAARSIKEARLPGSTKIISADDYMLDHKGDYRFATRLLPECHQMCQAEYLSTLTGFKLGAHSRVSLLIVDNTNTSVAELGFYADLARCLGIEMNIRTIVCDPEVAFQRNIHKTPKSTVYTQNHRLRTQTEFMAPWWPRHTRWNHLST